MTTKLLAKPPKQAEPSKPKILIFGKAGVGKTWTSLDFPGCYYIDTEGGADLAHYTDKLEKSGGVYMGPNEGALDFKTVIDQVKALATEKHDYKTLIIDSVSKLFNQCVSIEAVRLGDKNAFGADKKPAIANMRQLVSWISKLDMNVIFIAHEKMTWIDEKQGPMTFDCWDKLDYELHLCMQILKKGSDRVAIVRKSRLTEFPDASQIPWSYDEFAKRYGKEVMEKKAVAIEVAKTDDVLEVKRLLENVRVSQDVIDKWFTSAAVNTWEEMTTDQIAKVITHLKSKIK